ncbi:choice-of-anchor X domain-containing protein [Cellulophaga sp. Asnod2-G02]|uniref:choice-of-anchor X domain-containing protein n=1 Tax=Cellulophaga sp. Asnod2-G02 TaxID=3160572 RepID=UPI00386EB954
MKTPMSIINRPFSVEPITKIMIPDGIFDTAFFNQEITCYYTNTSKDILKNVSIYLEGIGDPSINITAKTHIFPEIPPGSSVLVSWNGNFKNTSCGKKTISFISKANGFELARTLKQIFVTKTTYDEVTKKYYCECEEGVLAASIDKVIISKEDNCKCDDNSISLPPIWIPSNMKILVTPNPSYSGQFGDLPFQDPWWKILAVIVAIVAAIGAVIAAIAGEGTAAIAVSGEFEETDPSITCCEPDPETTADIGGMTIAGVLSVIAVTAIAVALSDAIDPWRRGQEATLPKPGELTISEEVNFEIKYNEVPQAGIPYSVNVNWKYVRYTTGENYELSVSEDVKNIHVSEGVDIITPKEIYAYDDIIIEAKFYKVGKNFFKGIELFAFALLKSPEGVYFYLNLKDDGINADKKANDGLFTGKFNTEEAVHLLKKKGFKGIIRGLWRIFVYAQDVNDASPDMIPTEAATHIGGFMIASASSIKFDSGSPCPLTANATVLVI